MQKPRELRRLLFSFSDAAEALAGRDYSGKRQVSVSRGPKPILTIRDNGKDDRNFSEIEMVDALSRSCHQFMIPVPLHADKRIIIDRNAGNVILQIAIDMIL